MAKSEQQQTLVLLWLVLSPWLNNLDRLINGDIHPHWGAVTTHALRRLLLLLLLSFRDLGFEWTAKKRFRNRPRYPLAFLLIECEGGRKRKPSLNFSQGDDCMDLEDLFHSFKVLCLEFAFVFFPCSLLSSLLLSFLPSMRLHLFHCVSHIV